MDRPEIAPHSVLCTLAMVLAACSAEREQDAAIAESWAPGAEWSLEATPELRIGADPTDTVLQFTTVRTARLLPDDRIVVGHLNRPPVVFVITEDGQGVQTLGRAGEGPGEFLTVGEVWIAQPDTIVVYDPRNSRLTYLLADGAVIRTVRFGGSQQGGGSMPGVIIGGRFRDDTYLARPNAYLRGASGAAGRTQLSVERRHPDGSVADTIGVFPDVDFVRMPDGQYRRRLFSKRAAFLASRDSYFTGMGDDFTIGQYALDGTLIRQFQRPYAIRAVTDEMLKAYESPRPPPVEPPEPEKQLPAHGRRLIRDREDNLWVQGYVLVDDSVVVWSVFNETGAFLGEVTVDRRLELHDIAENFVIGVWTDDLDVETVVRVRLIKPAAGSSSASTSNGASE